MFKRILVTLDGSDLAQQALEPAFEIARKFGGEVILLRVAIAEPQLVALPAFGEAPLPDYALQRDREEAEAYLHGLKLEWYSRGAPIHTEIITGNPAEMILDVAEVDEADLIVMSTHGRSGLSRLIYGSVAESVLRGARAPVLLIPVRK